LSKKCADRDSNPGHRLGRRFCVAEIGEVINYRNLRGNFVKWLNSRVSKDYARQLITYLDRFVGESIRGSEDVIEILERSTSKKNMVLGLRNLVNYCEERGVISPLKADELRRVLKCVKTRVDAYVPSDEEVRSALRKFEGDYKLVFRLLAFSGLRVREAIRMLSEFDERRLMVSGNAAKYPLFSEKGSKRAFFAYMPRGFLKELKKVNLSDEGVRQYFHRRGLPPKYLRKWQYNFMILNNVPESVADFIQGRAATSVGSLHYLSRVKQADHWYGNIAEKLFNALPL